MFYRTEKKDQLQFMTKRYNKIVEDVNQLIDDYLYLHGEAPNFICLDKEDFIFVKDYQAILNVLHKYETKDIGILCGLKMIIGTSREVFCDKSNFVNSSLFDRRDSI